MVTTGKPVPLDEVPGKRHEKRRDYPVRDSGTPSAALKVSQYLEH